MNEVEESNMKNIIDLITLEKDEKILKVVQDLDRMLFFSQLDRTHYDLETLPDSLFKISDEKIYFKNTHVFTNKRYINIAVNFWQLRPEYYELTQEKITVDNYILSIPKENFHSVQITKETSYIRITLNDIVRVYFRDSSKYENFRKFLVECWDFSQEELKSEEKNFIHQAKLNFTLLNFSALLFVISLMISNFFGFSENKLNLFFIISFSVCGCVSISEILIIFFTKKKKFFSLEFWSFRRLFFLFSIIGILGLLIMTRF